MTVDLSRAHFWDITAVQTLDRVVARFQRESVEVNLIGLNQASATIVGRYSVHGDKLATDSLTDARPV